MAKRLSILLLLGLIAALPAAPAAAVVLTFDFVATQDGGPAVASGFFRYDTDAVDMDPANPIFGVYTAVFEVSVTGGPQDGGFFSVADTVNINSGRFVNFIEVQNDIGPAGGTSFLALGAPPGLFPDDSLPTSITLSDFTDATQLGLQGEDLGAGSIGQVDYTVIAIELRQLPLPATAALFAVGIAALGWRTWRRA